MYLMLSLHYILKYPGCRDQGGRFREPSSWAGGSCWHFHGFLGLLLAVLGASSGCWHAGSLGSKWVYAVAKQPATVWVLTGGKELGLTQRGR